MEQRMYWKTGFYNYPVDGGVEISVEYWQELLAGQSAGKQVIEDEKGCPVLIEYEPSVDDVRAEKLAKLQAYDASDSVNQFSIGSISGWLNKSTRVGLINSIAVEKESGRKETSIWLGDTLFVLTIEKAIDMLHRIELYALECYNVTQGHIRAINQLRTREAIETYDFRTGYPGKLSFAG